MKKIISILITALLLISIMTISVSAENNTVIIKGDTVYCEAGEQVSVALRVTENSGFNTLLIRISYDSRALTFVSITNKVSQFTITKPSNDPYKSGNKYLWDSAKTYSNTGELVILNFKVADNAPDGCYDIAVSFIESYKAEGSDIVDVSVSVSGAKIYVGVEENETEKVSEATTSEFIENVTEEITEVITEETTVSGTGSGGTGVGSGDSSGGYTPPTVDDTDEASEKQSSKETETDILTETMTEQVYESETLVVEETEIASETDSFSSTTVEETESITEEVITEVEVDTDTYTETEIIKVDSDTEAATNETESFANSEEVSETSVTEAESETEFVAGSCGSFASGSNILLFAIPVAFILSYRKDKK